LLFFLVHIIAENLKTLWKLLTEELVHDFELHRAMIFLLEVGECHSHVVVHAHKTLGYLKVVFKFEVVGLLGEAELNRRQKKM
jgi:hypothetical protein